MAGGTGFGEAAAVNDMTSPLKRPQIVIRVAPRLLGDVLYLALRSEGFDVELYPEDGAHAATVRAGRVELALVTEQLPGDDIADTILVLDPSGTTLSGASEVQDRPLGFAGELGALISLIEHHLREAGIPG
jgi:hypothetical protein